MSQFIEGEYKVRVDGSRLSRGPVIYVHKYWDEKDDWEFCEFESTEFRDPIDRNAKSKWKPAEDHEKLMATAILFVAAQKLLEACQKALPAMRWAATYPENPSMDSDKALFVEAAKMLESAIELATNTSAPIEKLVGGQPEREE